MMMNSPSHDYDNHLRYLMLLGDLLPNILVDVAIDDGLGDWQRLNFLQELRL